MFFLSRDDKRKNLLDKDVSLALRFLNTTPRF